MINVAYQSRSLTTRCTPVQNFNNYGYPFIRLAALNKNKSLDATLTTK